MDDKTTLHLCMGSACHQLGVYRVLPALQKLMIANGLDSEVELKGAFCLENCMHGIVVKIGEENGHGYNSGKRGNQIRQGNPPHFEERGPGVSTWNTSRFCGKLLWDYDPNGLIVLDLDMTIRLVNPAFCKMLRVDCDKVIGCKGVDILGDVDDFVNAWSDGVEIRGIEREYPQIPLYVRQVIFPIPNEELVAAIFVDLTNEWQQEKEMLKLKRQAIQEVTQVVHRQMGCGAGNRRGCSAKRLRKSRSASSGCWICWRRKMLGKASNFYDVYPRSLNRQGEELCGDQVKVLRHGGPDAGGSFGRPGSGVKASILATLTTEIIMTMLRESGPTQGYHRNGTWNSSHLQSQGDRLLHFCDR